jgi:hypothetical protein
MLGQLPAPPSSAGFPSSYPYAYSGPLPSAILRPLQQPLYDTELTTAAGTPNMIQFFQRQLGQTTAAGALVKTLAETNLSQPGQLANPLEFSLFGFTLATAPVPGGVFVTQADFADIYSASVFTFLYTGNRVYLQIPLNRIPQGVKPEGFSAMDNMGAPAERTQIGNGVGHISNFYKFTIGRSALRIRPTESFQVRLDWPTAAPTILAAGIRLQVHLLGLQWTPL